jgi:hypothetical protein
MVPNSKYYHFDSQSLCSLGRSAIQICLSMTKADSDPLKPLITLLSFFSTVGVLLNQGSVISLAEAPKLSGLLQPRPLKLSSDLHTLYRRKGGLLLRRHRQKKNQVFTLLRQPTRSKSSVLFLEPAMLVHVFSDTYTLLFDTFFYSVNKTGVLSAYFLVLMANIHV